ncbi:MAG TPA: TVP38/TMEM64 family protein [Stellaceae bacterium]|nr:TVP38/TMEM64 family protein [Stellaceae bacterium]
MTPKRGRDPYFTTGERLMTRQVSGAGSAVWLAAGAVVVGIAIGWYLLPVGASLDSLRGWLLGLGIAGVAVFAAIYVLGAVVLAPEALLTVAAGFVYGFWGLPIVIIAATAGASLAFLIARHVARDPVRRLIETRRNIAAIDKAVAADGWKIVALLRLSPLVPFNLQNYLLGLTAIPFRHFVAATFVGIIPGTALYTCLGVLGDAVGNGSRAKWVLFGAGVAATVAAVILVARKAGARLRDAGLDDPAS